MGVVQVDGAIGGHIDVLRTSHGAGIHEGEREIVEVAAGTHAP